jgi:hypothetical protein
VRTGSGKKIKFEAGTVGAQAYRAAEVDEPVSKVCLPDHTPISTHDESSVAQISVQTVHLICPYRRLSDQKRRLHICIAFGAAPPFLDCA